MEDGESANGLTIRLGGNGGARGLRFPDGREQWFVRGAGTRREAGREGDRERGRRRPGNEPGRGAD